MKWFTSARKIPSKIGRMPDGTKIPFGPFDPWALCATVGIFAAGYQLLGLNSDSSWNTWLVLALVAVGAGFMVGRMPTDGRNPLTVLTGALNQVTSPRTGRIAGKSVRLPKPHIVRGRTLIALADPQPLPSTTPHEHAPAPVPAPSPTPDLRQRRTSRRHPSAASTPTTVELTTPTPAAADPRPARSITALSGVQQLLAGLPHDHD